MSVQAPLGIFQRLVMYRLCLSRERVHCFEHAYATNFARSFSSTPCVAGKRSPWSSGDRSLARLTIKDQNTRAPRVEFSQTTSQENAVYEDIGLVQGTLIRAPFTTWKRDFFPYLWKLIKSNLTSLYSRSVYMRQLQLRGLSRWLPVNSFENSILRNRAEKLYHQLYDCLAKGDVEPVKALCLPPLYNQLQKHIAARKSPVIRWEMLTTKSSIKSRVVSHRAMTTGESGSAIRQVVVRIRSKQRRLSSNSQGEIFQPVEEFFVLQRKLINHKEEQWRIWGFTEPSTPQKIREDEAYFKRVLQYQLAASN